MPPWIRFLGVSFWRWLATVCTLSAAVLFAAFGQSSDQSTSSASDGAQTSTARYSTEVKVVNLLATVRDKHGQIINSLSKDDFALEEDGRPQAIKYFARETDLPLKLGLLVDTSMSTLMALPDERNASATFL